MGEVDIWVAAVQGMYLITHDAVGGKQKQSG